MRSRNPSVELTAVVIVALALFGTAMRATAQTETVLYSFGATGDGSNPYGSLAFDAAGNLYGATLYGGAYGSRTNYTGGTIFELTPSSGGGWTETLLHSFSSGSDGEIPEGGVILDASGNLYGTAADAGAYGQGTVFEMRPVVGGGWTFATLHSFDNNGRDGLNPSAGLLFDPAGNLYSTTILGGTSNNGTVFELTRGASGGWAEKTLHSFTHNGQDGFEPSEGNLTRDAVGNLYGAVYGGGLYGSGVVFELIPASGGRWTEKLLHAFGHGSDGVFPQSTLAIDASGNLYGTTQNGGTYQEGTVFELSPKPDGGWAYKIIYDFVYNGLGGFQPESGLTFDAVGNMYGVTQDGGNYGYGTVYKLSPNADGSWSETALHSFNFTSGGGDGWGPHGNLLLDSAGNIYGTTYFGGAHGEGTVFEVMP